MPEATPLMLHIHAAVAQEEARAISARTKAAAKARGKRLGSYGTDVLAQRWKAEAQQRADALAPILRELQAKGLHAARHGRRADLEQDRDATRRPLACRDGQ